MDIPFKRTGKVLIGFTEEDLESLKKSKELGEAKCLRQLAPYVTGKYAMYSPYSGIVNPFIYNIALAENASMNGVDFHFDNEVIAIDRADDLEVMVKC